MDPLTYYGWKALADKAPELLIVAILAMVIFRLGSRWIDRVGDVKAKQLDAVTEFGKVSVDRFLRAQEDAAISMKRISESFDHARSDQEAMYRAMRTMAAKQNEMNDLVKEIHERG